MARLICDFTEFIRGGITIRQKYSKDAENFTQLAEKHLAGSKWEKRGLYIDLRPKGAIFGMPRNAETEGTISQTPKINTRRSAGHDLMRVGYLCLYCEQSLSNISWPSSLLGDDFMFSGSLLNEEAPTFPIFLLTLRWRWI